VPGAIGWVAWSDPPARVALPTDAPLQITGFITDADGTPARQAVTAPHDGLAAVELDVDPIRIAP